MLAAACALVEQPPPPPGTQRVEVEVENTTQGLMVFGVTTSKAIVHGAAYPATLAPGATAVVTFYVPVEGFWRIVLDAEHSVGKGDAWKFLEPGCKAFIDVEGGGYARARCLE
jgi:hypothetical protein